MAPTSPALYFRATSGETVAPPGLSDFQFVRHVAKAPEHGCLCLRVAAAHERDGASVAEHLPIALGALDRRSRAGAFERFARNQAMIGQVDRDCDELSHVAHDVSSLSFLLSADANCRLMS